MKRRSFNRSIFWRALFAAVVYAAVAQRAAASWHDAYPGQDLVVHYVHLNGFGGDNAVNRHVLQIEYTACVARHKALGKSYKTISSASIPAIPILMDVEIYYSVNRTLTVKQSALHYIDDEACIVTARQHHTLELRSAIGRCDIDLLKREARGQCDTKAHQHASVTSFATSLFVKLPIVDMDKVPPALRTQVVAQMERLKHLPQAASTTAPSAAGTIKTIANYPCEIYRASSVNNEFCIAQPASSFTIPAAPFNAGIPGLLLEAKTPALTLLAQRVILNLYVSQETFALPPGVKVSSYANGAP